MVSGGVELLISMLHEPAAGPLVLFGTGGAAADALADRAGRLAPLTDSDADELIRSIRAAPLLLGRPGAAAADLGALRDLLLRVSRMADDLPQIAELELPVFARPDGAQAVDGRIRLQAAEPADAPPAPTAVTGKPPMTPACCRPSHAGVTRLLDDIAAIAPARRRPGHRQAPHPDRPTRMTCENNPFSRPRADQAERTVPIQNGGIARRVDLPDPG